MSELADFVAAHPDATVSEFAAHLKARQEASHVTVQAGLASATGAVPDGEED
jgi:hypothetical protein